MSGWTNYSSGTDSEDERQAGRIVFDQSQVAQLTPQERAAVNALRRESNRRDHAQLSPADHAHVERWRQVNVHRERQTRAARELADALHTTSGGTLATSTFKAFNGKAHRLVDGGRGITRALGAI